MRYVLILGFFLSFFTSSAATCTAVTGVWNTSGTWSCGHIPTNSDVVVVPANVTVTVDCNCGTYTSMTINVYGTLDFQNGKKINMDANSVVNVYTGGQLTGGNGGSQINIGGTGVYSGGGPPTSGPITLYSGGSTGLPIELLSFEATVLDKGGGVLLKWITATQTNNDFFTVERSCNGIDFTDIAKVKGAGNSSTQLSYSIIDPDPCFDSTTYYLLKQTDFNDKSTVSNMIALNLMVQEFFSIYPNPNNGKFSISINNQKQTQIEIYNLIGQKVLSQMLNILKTEIDLSAEQRGIYFMKVYNQDSQFTIRKIILQ